MKNDLPKPAPPTKRSPWFASLFSLRFFSDEMPRRSPHAVIDQNAEIAEDVEIGPFCVIGPDVKIDSGCRLLNSVTILGKTTVGKDNVFFPNAVIGAAPQDKKFKGETTELTIGAANVFREAVSIHIGTENGGGITRIGDNSLFMVNCHVGHDAQIANNCVIANNVMLAGHVVVHNNVAIMGGVGVHHFVTIGEYAYIGGFSRIHHDVPPYCKVDGADQVRGINAVGLRRAGIPADEIETIDAAVRDLFSRRKPLAVAMAEFNMQNGLHPNIKRLLEFLGERSEGKHGRHLEGLRTKSPPSPL